MKLQTEVLPSARVENACFAKLRLFIFMISSSKGRRLPVAGFGGVPLNRGQRIFITWPHGAQSAGH
jgi:hypothetical protein